MRGAACRLLLTWAFIAPAIDAHAQQEIIAAIQVGGNTVTPDQEVVADSGLTLGMPFSEGLLVQTASRLMATRKFQHAEVLKRFASIADSTQISVLIRVDEGPVRVVSGAKAGQPARVVRRRPLNVMIVPLLDAEDGYGLSYGAQFAVTGNTGTSQRLLIPLSWGGDKKAAVEFQRDLSLRFTPRLSAGVLAQRRTHPFFKSDADRTRMWVRSELSGAGALRRMRAGVTAARQVSSLMARTDAGRSLGADLVLDTRPDPMLPRNAVFAKVAIERWQFSGKPLTRTELTVEGGIASYRGAVLMLAAHGERFNEPPPPFLKAVLGGADSLRGFRAGTAIGDAMVNGSAEVRIPLTSPLTLAKLGANAFIDTGTAYDVGQRATDQKWKRGIGGGVWATAALFRMSFVVARGMGTGTRVHFGAGLTF